MINLLKNLLKKFLSFLKAVHKLYKDILFKGIDLTIPDQSNSKTSQWADALTCIGFILLLIYTGLLIYRSFTSPYAAMDVIGTIIWSLFVFSLSLSTLLDHYIMAKKGYDRFYIRFAVKSVVTVGLAALDSYSYVQSMHIA